MPLFAVIGANSESGQSIIEIVSAPNAAAAEEAVQARGVYTSEVLLVDSSRQRITSAAIQAAASHLCEIGRPEIGIVLFRRLWDRIDDWNPFSKARIAVPYLIQAGCRDEAWALIQQARISSWSREMFSVGAEKTWLLRLASDVLEADGRALHSSVLRVAELAGLAVSRDDAPDKQELSTRIAVGLEDLDLPSGKDPWEIGDKIADSVLETLRSHGQVAAVWLLEEQLVSACGI